jgi:hypothetical protein
LRDSEIRIEMARRRTWRERMRGDFRERVILPSGATVLVAARPKIDRSAPFDAPLPSLAIAVWAAVLELRFTINEKRHWVVQVYPLGRPTEARPIAALPKWQAFERVESEAAALGETAG